MTDKPSYIGLLNAISVAETEAGGYFSAWAATTPSDEVRQVIQTVALREAEHGLAFAKRLCELGFEVRPKEDAKAAERCEIASSTTLSDREKFEKLDVGQPIRGDGGDFFDSMFTDKTIDIQTGTLLGRYIAEERDSGRLLRSCYQACQAAESNGQGDRNSDGNGAAHSNGNGDLEGRVANIEGLLQQVLARLG